MNFKKYLAIAGLLSFLVHSYGNGLEITNVTPNEDYSQLSFDISWENSWRQTERFHDAVWVFIKYRPDNGIRWEHAHLTGGATNGNLEVISQQDSVGIFLRNAADFTGDVTATNVTVDVSLDRAIAIHPDFKVFGIEMVYVPEEGFYYGDNSAINRKIVDKNNEYFSLFRDSSHISQFIDSEKVTLEFFNDQGMHEEDFVIPSSAMSTGYSDFYCMKYPITQGQFVDFLNCLTEQDQRTALGRDIFNHYNQNQFIHDTSRNYRQGVYITTDDTTTNSPVLFVNDLNRNGIFNEPNDGKDIVLNFNFASPAYDSAFIYPMLSFLFWSGLAPMNEMQYEKACRGPMKPVKNEYAWGHSHSIQPPSLIDAGTTDERFSVTTELPPRFWHKIGEQHPLYYRAGISADPGDNRSSSGKSFWGISDLSGNGKELVLSIESISYYSSGHHLYLGNGDPVIPYLLTERALTYKNGPRITLHHLWLLKTNVSEIKALLFYRDIQHPSYGKTRVDMYVSGRGIR